MDGDGGSRELTPPGPPRGGGSPCAAGIGGGGGGALQNFDSLLSLARRTTTRDFSTEAGAGVSGGWEAATPSPTPQPRRCPVPFAARDAAPPRDAWVEDAATGGEGWPLNRTSSEAARGAAVRSF